MKQTIIRYGLYGGTLICILFLLSFLLGDGLDFTTQEVIGYASMVISLSLVFFGIRHYRDHQNSGSLRFGTGLRIGLGITLITALMFGLLDVIYVKYLNPDFMDSYYSTVLADLKANLPEAEYLERERALEEEKALFMNPWMNFFVMFITVFLIGFVITLISTLALKRKPSAVA